jgi:hypothetical protein
MLRCVALIRTTRLHIPEDGILHSHSRENGKSYLRYMRCKISGFHDGDYEECRFLGCEAVWFL